MLFFKIPSTNLTANTIILKFKGRSSQKITIPNKPISIEFQLFALGDSGYIYNWEYIRPSLVEGVLIEKKRISINISNSTTSTFLNPI
jgi:hypothetical protein